MQLTAETECWKTRTDTVLSCHHLTAFVSNGFYVFTFFWMENKPAKPKTAKKGTRNISNLQSAPWTFKTFFLPLTSSHLPFQFSNKMLKSYCFDFYKSIQYICICLLTMSKWVNMHNKIGTNPNHNFSQVKTSTVISRSKIIIMLHYVFLIKYKNPVFLRLAINVS